MSIFSRFAAVFSRQRGEVRPQNVTYSDAVMEAFGAVPGAAGVSVTPVSAMRVAAVFACVQKIASAIASLPVDLYEFDANGAPIKLARDDVWFKLNEQPHPQLTAASFWEGATAGELLRGDSYAWVRRSANNSIRDILPLPHGATSPVRQSDGSVRYYISLPEFGITTWLAASDVLHLPGFAFDMHTMRSMSALSYGAKQSAGNALAMDEYSGRFFQGGAHPSIILSTDKTMSPAQQDQLRAAFAAKYGGVENAHKLPLVLAEGIKAEKISLSAEDAQLIEARKYTVVDIARAFGVPPHMIGETSGSSAVGAGYEEQGRNFAQYTINAHLMRFEQELNRKLNPRNGGRFWRFDRTALQEATLKAQAEYNRAALGGPGAGQGWMTVNEIRRKQGLPPIAGGDVIFDPRTVKETTDEDPAAAA